MMKIKPVMMTWDGEKMIPQPRFMPLCNKQFTVHEAYPLIPVEDRSMKSHSHFFASLHEMWNNLPEDIAKRWPTVEHMRAWALVHAGFYIEKDYVCDSTSKAKYLARIIRAHSEYAVIKVSGNVVKVYDPKSQSVAAMGAEEFQDSKEKVLDVVAALNPGLSRAAIAKEAAKVAPPEKAAKTTANPPAGKPPERLMAPEGPLVAPPLNRRASEAPKPSVPNQPRSASEYFAHARTWIMAGKDKNLIWRKWDGEREIRDSLRVSVANRKELTNLIERQIKELESVP